MGTKGFDYAGNSRTDLAVWRAPRNFLICNASPSVTRLARKIGPVLGEFEAPCNSADGTQGDASLSVGEEPARFRADRCIAILLGRSGAGECAIASSQASVLRRQASTLLINDLCCDEADRAHQSARRPIASGDLPPGIARGAGRRAPVVGICSCVCYRDGSDIIGDLCDASPSPTRLSQKISSNRRIYPRVAARCASLLAVLPRTIAPRCGCWLSPVSPSSAWP